MMNVIAIFDIGKTNKKLVLFDEQYRIVGEEACLIDESRDEDGEPCEDLGKLTSWVIRTLSELQKAGNFQIRAVNFSAYGASLVHIGENNSPIAPLYNYLKPYPAALKEKFYQRYGGEITFSMLTASPVLGSLNSGMQLYRIKEEQPELFERIKVSLHLPQYLSWLVTGVACSDITSIGCHTNLWNFSQNHYHEWVYREGIMDKLAPIMSPFTVLPLRIPSSGSSSATSSASAQPPSSASAPQAHAVAGIGLHDSSAAMIPYLESFREPFVLISTGTWCISMNPFNEMPLTVAELQKDCLCYMSYQARPVKSARLFAGYEHEQQVRRLNDHFHKAPDYYTHLDFDPHLVSALRSGEPGFESHPKQESFDSRVSASVFAEREFSAFTSYEEAYHRLLMDIMQQQTASTRLVLEGTELKRIFVDGGFGRNQVYMHLLAAAFPDIEVFAASIPQASAMGAALAIHRQWNGQPLPGDIIELKYYS